MSSSSHPILPPEVIDMIIDNLHNHPRTLRACGLVSRNWLGRSRHYLFMKAIYVAARDLEGFHGLLKSPYNTLAFHLRNIRLTGLRYDELTQLWPLLPTFSHLNVLHIYGNPITFDSHLVETQKLASVRSVALSRAIFASYGGLNAFLLQFPMLRTLELDRVSGFFRGADTEFTPLHFTLDALKMTVTAELLAWLRWTEFLLGAHFIELSFDSMESGISEYLNAVGVQLQRLHLKFRNSSQLAIFSEHPRLSGNTALRSIRITHAFYILGETNVAVPPSLPRLLRQLESSAIEELEFDATLANTWMNPSLSPPQEVAAILDAVGANFARLRKISFHGPWDWADDILGQQFTSIVSALLPVQTARGIVRIVPHAFT
ncbi:hypothetical protein C8R46DRAFT_466351 [Mycena filopes]|nr:hypothetical protein C8R46DRAFT_466351 [Mycena filopes]